MKTGKILPYLAIVITMICWGMSFIWTSTLLEYLPPVTIVSLRLFFSSILLFLYLGVRKRIPRFRGKWLKWIIASALFQPFLYFIGETYGLLNSSATISAIIISTIPVLTPLFAWIFLRENVGWIRMLGLIISFIGVSLVIISDQFELNVSLKGLLFLVLAVVSGIMYGIVAKKLNEKYSAVQITSTQNIIGFLLFLPLFFILDFKEWESFQFNSVVLMNLLALVVFASSIAFIFFVYSLGKLGLIQTTLWSNLMPVVAVVAAYFILNEKMTNQQIIGMVIVLVGIIVSQLGKRNKIESIPKP